MDKMLDQALRAVNESYRLIRIGKKNLRRRTDSLIGGNCISRSTHSSSTSLNNNTLNESSLDGSGVGSINSEKYLRLMNSVLELHKSLLDMIDTTNGEIPADLGDGEVSHRSKVFLKPLRFLVFENLSMYGQTSRIFVNFVPNVAKS